MKLSSVYTALTSIIAGLFVYEKSSKKGIDSKLVRAVNGLYNAKKSKNRRNKLTAK